MRLRFISKIRIGGPSPTIRSPTSRHVAVADRRGVADDRARPGRHLPDIAVGLHVEREIAGAAHRIGMHHIGLALRIVGDGGERVEADLAVRQIGPPLDDFDRAAKEGADPLGMDDVVTTARVIVQAVPRQAPSMAASGAIASRWAAIRAAGSGGAWPKAGTARARGTATNRAFMRISKLL